MNVVKWDLFPKLEPKTISAYRVAEKVVMLAREEPRRLGMQSWCTFASPYSQDPQPACGTVACLAGWTTLIVGRYAEFGAALTGSMAVQILCGPPRPRPNGSGSTYEWDAYEDDIRMRYELDRCFMNTNPSDHTLGTAEYVNDALRPFRAWMEAWRYKLQDVPVKIEPFDPRERYGWMMPYRESMEAQEAANDESE